MIKLIVSTFISLQIISANCSAAFIDEWTSIKLNNNFSETHSNHDHFVTASLGCAPHQTRLLVNVAPGESQELNSIICVNKIYINVYKGDLKIQDQNRICPEMNFSSQNRPNVNINISSNGSCTTS